MAAVVLTLIELDERGVAWITGTQVTVIEVATHPAMTVPCGMSDGLPIGLMLIGKHCDELMISRAAYAFEQAGDWKAM